MTFASGIARGLATLVALAALCATPAGAQPMSSPAAFGYQHTPTGLFFSKDLGYNDLIGCSWSWCQTLRWDPAAATYQQIYISPTTVDFNDTIAWAALGEVTGSGPRELVVFRWNERIEIYDQSTHLLVRSFATGLPDGHPLAMTLMVDDVDRRAGAEIAVSNGDQVRFFDSAGQLLWLQTGLGGAMVTGQMDRDPSLEIATSTGHVLDFDSRTVQWVAPSRFGGWVEAGDFDGDGMDEVIGTYPDLFAYDVDTERLIWSFPYPHGVGALELTDLDSDGRLELVVGSAQWDDLMTLDPLTLDVEWTLDNPGYGTRALVIEDTDSDGQREVIWTTEGTLGIFVADWTRPAIEWSAADLGSSFLVPAVGDLDGDGNSEVVVSSDWSEGGAGRLFVLSGDRMQPLAVSAPLSGGRADLTTALALEDLDHDGDDEIVATVAGSFNATIQAWDYVGGSEPKLEPLWLSGALESGGFGALAVGDLDGDGESEIVVTSSESSISAYDSRTRQRLWRSSKPLPRFTSIWNLEVVPDGRGGGLVAALASERAVIFLDSEGHGLASLEGPYTAFDSRFRNGRVEVVTAELGGRVCDHVVRPKGNPRIATLSCRSLGHEWTHAIAYAGNRRLWVAANGRIHFYTATGALPLLVSENYGIPHTHTAAGQGLATLGSSIVFSNGLFSVRRYELAPAF